MSDAVYVRLYDEDLDFIRSYSKQKKIDKSKLIKKFVHTQVKRTKVELALQEYKEGLKTIREGAQRADMTYREFMNELAKRNLIGPSAEEQEKIMEDTLSL
jgi:predicted HTH domain antitoxin